MGKRTRYSAEFRAPEHRDAGVRRFDDPLLIDTEPPGATLAPGLLAARRLLVHVSRLRAALEVLEARSPLAQSRDPGALPGVLLDKPFDQDFEVAKVQRRDIRG